MTEESRSPLIARLQYRQGETIIKQGDFGVSIYLIVRGKVEILIESGGEEVSLAKLGPGEVIGEMSFLTGDSTPRSATVRALLITELEAWHPSMLKRQYDELPYIIRHMAGQTIQRLLRMNRMFTEMKNMKTRKGQTQAVSDWQEKRRHYRKKVDIECMYRPAAAPTDEPMWGQILDISRRGLQLEISDINTFRRAHDPGEQFAASAFLPTGKRVDLNLRVVRTRQAPRKGQQRLGTIFVDLSESASKNIGFFLMP